MSAKKLRIKEGMEIIAVNTPADYKKSLGELPPKVKIKNEVSGKHDVIHLFVRNKAEAEKQFPKAVKALKPGGLLWTFYPKAGTKHYKDLTRDKGWEALEKIKLRWASLISFNEEWTAFLMKNEAPVEQTKASKDYQENAAAVTDAKTRTVIVPDQLKTLLGKNKSANTFFETLSFTNKKEYVMWLVSAKREETRQERLKKIIEKLTAGKKNPAEK